MHTLKQDRRIIGKSLKYASHKIGDTPKAAAGLFHRANMDFIQPIGKPIADLAIIADPAIGIPLRAGIGAINAVDSLGVKFAGHQSTPQPKQPYALMR